jgi:hypothetical protein
MEAVCQGLPLLQELHIDGSSRDAGGHGVKVHAAVVGTQLISDSVGDSHRHCGTTASQGAGAVRNLQGCRPFVLIIWLVAGAAACNAPHDPCPFLHIG